VPVSFAILAEKATRKFA